MSVRSVFHYLHPVASVQVRAPRPRASAKESASVDDDGVTAGVIQNLGAADDYKSNDSTEEAAGGSRGHETEAHQSPAKLRPNKPAKAKAKANKHAAKKRANAIPAEVAKPKENLHQASFVQGRLFVMIIGAILLWLAIIYASVSQCDQRPVFKDRSGL